MLSGMFWYEVKLRIILIHRREKSDRDLYVIVLADTHLLGLPLEAMEIFQAKNIRSVTRDFSLQVLCHRLEKFTANEPSKSVQKVNKEIVKKEKLGLSGSRTRDLSHPKRESYH